LIIKRFRSATVALSTILVLFAGLSFGSESKYEEGKHYQKLSVPIQTEDPKKIEVTEYFSYGCPHCFRFEGLISQWKSQLESDIVFKRSPAIWNVPGYQVFARTYYTLESLGVLPELHLQIF
jgi:thiol:disulfide interchange protein DsbA